MSRSTDTRALATRLSHTNEPRWAATPGIGRGKTHGLDTCVTAQTLCRAALALFVINQGRCPNANPFLQSVSPGRDFITRWGVSSLARATVSWSSRYRELIITSDAPDDVVSTLRIHSRRGQCTDSPVFELLVSPQAATAIDSCTCPAVDSSGWHIDTRRPCRFTPRTRQP